MGVLGLEGAVETADSDVAMSINTTSPSETGAETVPAGSSITADMSPIGLPGQSLYVDSGADRVHVVHHRPPAQPRRDVAVVLCPPFGWEEEAAHRSLRAWATQLAQAGYPAVRLRYPGTGDSSGLPTEPDRLGAWSRSVAAVADWIRAAEGVRAVVALGMGFGSMVAFAAAADGTALDGLALWAAPAKGREVVRQLRAFSRMEHAESFANLPEPPPTEDGAFSAGGYVLSGETIAALEAFDLTGAELAGPLPAGVLLLDREGVGSTDKLRDALARQGVEVAQQPGDGYTAMTLGAQEGRLSPTVAASVRAWLDERSSPLTAPAAMPTQPDPPAPVARASLQIDVDGVTVTETPIEIPQPSGTILSGVLAEPAGDRSPVCAVFVNAGAIDRTGPSRMWVEAARRWAATRGVRSLRVDIEGIGESEGPDNAYVDSARFHDAPLVDQVHHTLDYLQAQGIADRFLLVGMCAGAFWSYHASVDDPRISAFVSLNQRVLVWDDGLGQARDLRRVLVTRAILRIREPESRARVKAILRWLWGVAKGRVRATVTRSGQPLSITAANDLAVSRLLRSSARATFVFARGETLEEELERSGRLADLQASPNIEVERIAVVNHTLRPLWAQDEAHAILDRALDRELQRPPRAS